MSEKSANIAKISKKTATRAEGRGWLIFDGGDVLFEGVLHGVVGYHLFFEDVGAGFGRFYHFDDFRVGAAFTGLKGCNGFLCHISGLFNFFVNGYALKDGVVFLKLKSFGCVLAVFGGYITGGTGHTACLMFGAFEDYLHTITFCFLCHSSLES